MKLKIYYGILFLIIIPFVNVYSQCIPAPNLTITTANTIVNTYFSGTGTVAAGSQTITIDGSSMRGSTNDIQVGDLIMIMQMQGAEINTTLPDMRIGTCASYSYPNNYGDGAGGNDRQGLLDNTNFIAGRYEYALAGSNRIGNTITIQAPLQYTYIQNTTPTATIGARKFQVIRVANHNIFTIQNGASITAPKWDGLTGGVIAIDAGTRIVFNTTAASIAINAEGLGFRGGYRSASFPNATPNYNQIPAENIAPTGGSWYVGYRGEGIVGTPAWVWDINGRTAATDTYPGSRVSFRPQGCNTGNVRFIDSDAGFGAAGNAGGSSVEDMGGGGGSNASIGGDGSYSTSGTYRTFPVSKGGAALNNAEAQSGVRLFLGGGGGSGGWDDDNNDTDQAGSGQPGGGIIIIRAADIIGQGIITVRGVGGFAQTSEGAGGGGAGGAILIATGQTALNLTLNAGGGNGNTSAGTSGDGGGGGGSGGRIILFNINGATPITTTSQNVTAGSPGASSAGVVAANAGNGGISSATAPPGFVPFVCNPVLLPITLLNFAARHYSDNSVLVDWQTVNELDNKGFYVQRSIDGKEFKDLTFVIGNGTTGNLSSYEFIDQEYWSGTAYYRLKQVDSNGKTMLTRTVSVERSFTNLPFTLYPNPNRAGGELHLRGITNKLSIQNLQIISITGQQVLLNPTIKTTFDGIAIDLPQRMAKGIYIVQFVTEFGMQNYKFVIE